MSRLVETQIIAICRSLAVLYRNSLVSELVAARFVCSQIRSMPTFLRLAFWFITLLVFIGPFFLHGRTFRDLSKDLQLNFFVKLKSSRIFFLRDYAKAIEGLFIFALYSESTFMEFNNDFIEN